jgi:hypothetical protein
MQRLWGLPCGAAGALGAPTSLHARLPARLLKKRRARGWRVRRGFAFSRLDSLDLLIGLDLLIDWLDHCTNYSLGPGGRGQGWALCGAMAQVRALRPAAARGAELGAGQAHLHLPTLGHAPQRRATPFPIAPLGLRDAASLPEPLAPASVSALGACLVRDVPSCCAPGRVRHRTSQLSLEDGLAPVGCASRLE